MSSDNLDVRILEQRLAEVQREARIGTWSVNVPGNVLEWSDETCRIFGLLPGSPMPAPHEVIDFVHGDDRETVRQELRALMANGQRTHADHRIVRRDGVVRWVHDHIEAVRDETGRVVRLHGTVQDVTERRQAELALRVSEQRFRAVFDQAFQLVAMLDANGVVLDVNRRALELIGVGREAVVGKSFVEAGWWTSEPERLRCRHAIAQAAAGESVRFETSRQDRRGARIDLDFSLSPVTDADGRVVLLVAEGRDISEHMKAERARRETEARFRAMFDNAYQHIHLLSSDGRVLAVNQTALDGAGLELGQVIGQNFCETSWWCHGDEAERCRDGMRRAVAGEFVRFETVFPDRDGGLRDVDFSLTPIKGEGGSPGLLIAEAHDISARMRAERAFRESEARYRDLTEVAPYGVVVHDFNRVVYANPAALRLIGVANVEELGGRSVTSLVHPDSIPAVAARMARLAQAGGALEFIEEKLLRADGEPYVAEVGGRAITWNGQPASQLVIRDISHRKRFEQALHQAFADLERSNIELREFAHVTSHDLQEPLRTIVNYLQLIERRDGERLSAQSAQDLSVVTRAAWHMADVIKDLLAYARIDMGERAVAPASCRDAAEQAIAHLSNDIQTSGAIVQLGILPEVWVDREQLIRLFQNLIGNALKYRADGRTPRVEVSAAPAQPSGWTFTVRDNGIGIDPRHHEQIFKLFQRLHGQDSYAGTGIGLATCRKIVERHHGRIWVDSMPGAGSAFHFILPSGN